MTYSDNAAHASRRIFPGNRTAAVATAQYSPHNPTCLVSLLVSCLVFCFASTLLQSLLYYSALLSLPIPPIVYTKLAQDLESSADISAQQRPRSEIVVEAHGISIGILRTFISLDRSHPYSHALSSPSHAQEPSGRPFCVASQYISLSRSVHPNRLHGGQKGQSGALRKAPTVSTLAQLGCILIKHDRFNANIFILA